MSEANPSEANVEAAAVTPAVEADSAPDSTSVEGVAMKPPPSRSNIPTPASSVTGIPVSKLKAPSSFGSNSSVSKIGRPCCTHTTPKAGPPPRDTNSMSRESDDNLSSINSAYADHNSAVLTANTELFIIGQRVWVGGIRSGQIAYIGETHFAPGDWAGIVLDEPNGKNDGCVSGKRYFQCEPKRGIFSRLTRLTLYPMSGAQTPTSPLAKNSPERSRTVSPTASVRSSMLRSPSTGKNGLTVGDRVIVSSGFGSRPGILRYLGETQFAPGNWCGVELDEASGKNDGAVDGIRYFECKPKYGVFVPIAKVSLSPSSKKTRLSRTGSRESLTSIGTMNSIATTNTSRMRMNAQQRKSITPQKPIVTTPKSQFSMQDLLREKQHHVEQLMVERELDREDAQNQALQLQKNINELKARIVQLETQLGDERKKSEDLQFSIDEAQFCGDELNAQTQVYKEKINALESKITHLVSGAPSLQSIEPIEDKAALSAAEAQIAELQKKLDLQEKQNGANLAERQEEEQRLLENIKYLQSENENLQKELVGKDESLEKFSLSQCGIENLRSELALLKEEHEKQTEQAKADFEAKLSIKMEELKNVTDEMQKLKNAADSLESERSNITDEYEILQTEIKMRDEQVKELTHQVDELTVQLSVQQADSSALDEMLKAQLMGSEQSKGALEQKVAENGELKKTNEGLEQAKTTLEQQLSTINAELLALKQQQQTAQQELNASVSLNEQKETAIAELNKSLESLQKQLKEMSLEKDDLTKQLSTSNEQSTTSIEQLQRQLEEKQKVHDEVSEKAQQAETALAATQVQLETLQQQSKASSEQSASELEKLKAELSQLRASLSQTESESHSAAGEMSKRIAELEAQQQLLQTQLQQAAAAADQMQQKYTELQSKNVEQSKQLEQNSEALENSQQMLQNLTKEHETVRSQTAVLESQLKASVESCAQRELELGDVTRKHEALQSKCETLHQQHEALQSELLAARGSATELQATLKQLNEELQSKQKTYAELEQRNSSQHMELASDNEVLKQANAKFERELTDLREALSKAKADIAEKQTQLSKLEELNIKQELSLSDASRQQENLQTRCEGLQQQNETLEQQLNGLRTSSTDSNAELVKLTQELVAKQKAYEELSNKSGDERATLEGQLQANQQRIDALCSQVEVLTQELKASTEQTAELHATLKTEQEAAGKQNLELSDALRKLEAQTAKCGQLEQEQGKLQQDLNATRNSSSELNAKLLQLTEQLAAAQKEQASQKDASSSERLQLERELQETKQQLQSSQAEAMQLQAELVTATEAKSLQATEFASLKAELTSKARNELAQRQESESAAREQLVAEYEARLQGSEQIILQMDESNKRLQSELQQTQQQLSEKQTEHKTQMLQIEEQLRAATEKHQELSKDLQQLEAASSTATEVHSEMQSRLDKLQLEIKGKDEALQASQTQLQLQQNNGVEEVNKLQDQLRELRERLEINVSELQHKEQLAREDAQKIADLKTLVEAVQVANANISATNAELSTVLEVLQAEKSETAHIFELFEMEADMNAERLIEKLTGMKQELQQTHDLLEKQQSTSEEIQQKLNAKEAELLALEQREQSSQASAQAANEKLQELQAANEELQQELQQKQALLEKNNEFDARLTEYTKVIDEMDEAATAKSTLLQQLQARVSELETDLRHAHEIQQTTQLECKNLTRKIESLELEKARQQLALQTQANGTGGRSGGGDAPESLDTEHSLAKINFLNSIIADMQQKNDALKAKVQTLEMLPTDFTKPHAFDMLSKRKPAPRLFCDICDEFDKHETEDCPLQASDDRDYSPPPPAEANNNEKKERKLPVPRKYCESCEVFGHDTGECADDETY
ncbi:restin homolog isoform X3 [Scaptodrosophila lebanonensis]|uniref:Restin homolog isoform X3 n=2 Tax=Drosophila lebanonensis TaxID=7225 RepID=A0A6J2U3Z0_DROLE|nr:restin homolog isoform X3 [Scaptodrosophila lebanonensis]